MSEGEYRQHEATVSAVGDEVYVSLIDDQYLKMPPEAARRLGALLIVKASEAEGKPAPEVIVLKADR